MVLEWVSAMKGHKVDVSGVKRLSRTSRTLTLFKAVRINCHFTGYLKASARWGAGPKMLVGSVLGYFIGKLSYQSKCAEKLMQLPNSPLAELLRKQKGRMGFQESYDNYCGTIRCGSLVLVDVKIYVF
jgi:hypothetical protein